MRRVSEYLSLMVIGPVFLVIVFSLFSAVASNTLMQWLAMHEPFGTIVRAFGLIGPFLFVSGVFTFLYAFIPNTRVRFRAALIGGVVAGLLWAASGALFTRIVAASTQMVAIYAGFAIFLATLIWIYVSWVILLIGAQLSFYVQNPRYLRVGQGHVRLTSALRERLAFTVMLLVARKFVAGEPPWDERALAEDLQITGSALATVIRSLERAGLLTLTEDEELIPARDLESIQLCDVLHAVRDERQYETWLLWRARTEPVADEVANSVEAGMRERIQGTTLRELASQQPAP
jgi:membrane protein